MPQRGLVTINVHVLKVAFLVKAHGGAETGCQQGQEDPCYHYHIFGAVAVNTVLLLNESVHLLRYGVPA